MSQRPPARARTFLWGFTPGSHALSVTREDRRLVVMVTEKRRAFGVLLALGGPPSLVRRTIVLAGAALGGAGVLAGVGLGVLVVLVLTVLGIPRFPPDIASIYMVDTIPLRLLPGDLAFVLGLSMVEVVLAAMLPASRASRREPVEVLRWV